LYVFNSGKSHILSKHAYISSDHKKLLASSKYISDEVLWTFSVKVSVLPHTVSETGQNRTKVTIYNQQEVALSISAKKSTILDDLQGPLRTVSKHVRLSEPTTKI